MVVSVLPHCQIVLAAAQVLALVPEPERGSVLVVDVVAAAGGAAVTVVPQLPCSDLVPHLTRAPVPVLALELELLQVLEQVLELELEPELAPVLVPGEPPPPHEPPASQTLARVPGQGWGMG